MAMLIRVVVLATVLALAVASCGGGPSLGDCRTVFALIAEMQTEGQSQGQIARQFDAAGWTPAEFESLALECVDAHGAEKLRGR